MARKKPRATEPPTTEPIDVPVDEMTAADRICAAADGSDLSTDVAVEGDAPQNDTVEADLEAPSVEQHVEGDTAEPMAQDDAVEPNLDSLADPAPEMNDETRTDENARNTTDPAAATPVVTVARGRDPRLPPVGATIERDYKGVTLKVLLLENGFFQYEGQTFRSLSKLAQTITGAKAMNGFQFFGLGQSAVKKPRTSTPRQVMGVQAKIARIDELIEKLQKAVEAGFQALTAAQARREDLAQKAAAAPQE